MNGALLSHADAYLETASWAPGVQGTTLAWRKRTRLLSLTQGLTCAFCTSWPWAGPCQLPWFGDGVIVVHMIPLASAGEPPPEPAAPPVPHDVVAPRRAVGRAQLACLGLSAGVEVTA